MTTGDMERIAPLAPADFTPCQAELVGDRTHLAYSRVIARHPGMSDEGIRAATHGDADLSDRDRWLLCAAKDFARIEALRDYT